VTARRLDERPEARAHVVVVRAVGELELTRAALVDLIDAVLVQPLQLARRERRRLGEEVGRRPGVRVAPAETKCASEV
tara:strand:+ start:650 stop:883 length:234 start_codon:yes stop_codon:yes gene_type:complete